MTTLISEAEKKRQQSGFSLLETLVAITVLAISLTVILQLFSGSLNSVKLSEDYTKALVGCQGKMETLLLSNALEEGHTEGDFDDQFSWEANIERISYTEDLEKENTEGLFDISVRVRWKAGVQEKSVELNTITRGRYNVQDEG